MGIFSVLSAAKITPATASTSGMAAMRDPTRSSIALKSLSTLTYMAIRSTRLSRQIWENIMYIPSAMPPSATTAAMPMAMPPPR